MSADSGPTRPLDGASICIVFEHSLSNYARILEEIKALSDAGATIQLLTSHSVLSDMPRGLPVLVAPLDASIRESTLRWRPLRVVHNVLRNTMNASMSRLSPNWNARHRTAALRTIAPAVDLFWVVDYPGLPSTLAEAARAGVRVLYETVDLVPEYEHLGEQHRLQSLQGERALIGSVDGFITASESYADYYVQEYGTILKRRPTVRDNMPDHIVNQIHSADGPLRLLFLGSLMFDRPIMELIEAVALMKADVSMTFQGKNYLADAPAKRIAELGIENRVRVIDACPPETIVETAAEYDVGIVALRGADENECRASTSKLFTYMASGLAILGSNLPGIARLISEYRNGILVDGMNPQAWAIALDAIAELSNRELSEMKKRSLAAADLHSWERQRPAFIAEFVRAIAGEDTQTGAS